MAYSKSKYVEAAQKLLNQGKVAQAIAEYQHILKYEPKDQVTLMTIGELYIRQGETFQAIDYFERLAQIFVGDGFLTKAIAVYKRIAKLAPEEIRPLEKLADLYVQQGVMSEARPLFVQLAEIHLKSNRQGEAVNLLKKLLLAEPDNLRVQIRLADLYNAMGQTKDAVETYVSAAQRALARGDQNECEKLADRALKIDPKNSGALTIKARAHSSTGDHAQAAKTLETVTDLHKGGEQTELLLDLYLKDSDWDQAKQLALKVFDADEKNFGPAQKVVEAMLAAEAGEQAYTLLQKIQPAMTDSGEQEALGRLMAEVSAQLPNRLEPMEWLVDFYAKANDSFRLPDALAHLGDAFVAAKKFDKAKETFEKLVERQPESESAKRKLNEVLRKLGHDVPAAVPAAPEPEEEESLAVDLVKAPPAKLPGADRDPDAHQVKAKAAGDSPDANLDEDTREFISQSLTDVDLFASYGLTQKAVGLLEAILRRAPRHTPTLEKLLDFVLGTGDERRTAELAAQLEQLHIQSGDVASAERFGELRRRFQRAAGLTDEQVSAAVAAVTEPPPAPPAPPAKAAAPVPEAPVPDAEAEEAKEEVHEVDLSDEWASMLTASHAPDPAAKAPKAPKAPAAAPPSSASHVAEFDVPVETPAGETSNPFAEISEELPQPEPEPEPHKPAPKVRETPAAKAPKETPKKPQPEPDKDYELVLDADSSPPPMEQKAPRKPAPPAPRKQEPVTQSRAKSGADTGFGDEFLADLAKEIDGLGLGELAPPAQSGKASRATAPGDGKKPSKPKPPAHPAGPVDVSPLQEVFEEFRADLGEMGAEDAEEEDLETHYNLGIAFREMGLMEEAISEFQKVAKATERGRPFRYTMQCCTFLGLCFMDKGQPGVAAIWYERALRTPDLDPESALALRYDLGVAQESAGEPDAALKSFSQVYAMNIDYRDVGERIAALQRPTR